MWQKYCGYLISKFSPESENDFSYENILKVLERGIEITGYNIPESYLLWNQYRDFISSQLVEKSKIQREKIVSKLKTAYQDRLSVPHNTLRDTFTDYSTFITNNDNQNYEKELVKANKIYSQTLKKLELREPWETKIRENNSLENYAAYVQWEVARPKKQQEPELVKALYERTIHDYPIIPEVWDDYISYLSAKLFLASETFLVIERGLLACPHSGLLWAHKFRVSAIMGASLEELGDLKQSFNNIPNLKEPEEYINWKAFMIEWIGYLGRSIDQKKGNLTEDSLEELLCDCEDILERAKRDGGSDPNFELELTVFELFRKFNYDCQWEDLKKNHGNKTEYWLERIQFETESSSDDVYNRVRPIFDEALARSNIDWPEKINEKYILFERRYGTALGVQKALGNARVKNKIVQLRRQEAYQRSNFESISNPVPSTSGAVSALEIIDSSSSVKRAHDDIEMGDSDTQKLSQKETDQTDLLDSPSKKTPKQQHKTNERDRENNSVVVSKLPTNISEKDIHKYFEECGEILSLNLHQGNKIATIEFGDHFGALSALTKDKKKIKNSEIQVRSGEETTLWVTNFPPEYTEERIRELFEPFGKIMSIRFPSLKFNTHRRFFYIQFSNAHDAHKAVHELDGEQFGEYSIQVKISDPSKKLDRKGAMYEDREIFIKGLDFNAIDEKELREVLGSYGTIERVRLPLSRSNESQGRLHDGFGFVVFSKSSEAEAAINSMNETKLGSRIVHVSLASNKNRGPKQTSKLVLDDSLHGSKKGSEETSATDIKARTLTISNLPDTVNDSQLKLIFEKYGPLKQITLRTDLNSAKVEYANVADAGKAELALQGYIISGQLIKIGESSSLGNNPAGKSSMKFIPRAMLLKSKQKR